MLFANQKVLNFNMFSSKMTVAVDMTSIEQESNNKRMHLTRWNWLEPVHRYEEEDKMYQM